MEIANLVKQLISSSNFSGRTASSVGIEYGKIIGKHRHLSDKVEIMEAFFILGESVLNFMEIISLFPSIVSLEILIEKIPIMLPEDSRATILALVIFWCSACLNIIDNNDYFNDASNVYPTMSNILLKMLSKLKILRAETLSVSIINKCFTKLIFIKEFSLWELQIVITSLLSWYELALEKLNEDLHEQQTLTAWLEINEICETTTSLIEKIQYQQNNQSIILLELISFLKSYSSNTDILLFSIYTHNIDKSPLLSTENYTRNSSTRKIFQMILTSLYHCLKNSKDPLTLSLDYLFSLCIDEKSIHQIMKILISHMFKNPIILKIIHHWIYAYDNYTLPSGKKRKVSVPGFIYLNNNKLL